MQDIRKFLPQRTDYLFVDQIDMLDYNKTIKGQKYIKQDELWVLGNEEDPIIPGSYIFETMTQFGGLLLFKSDESFENKIFNGYVYRVDKLKFIRHCKPGDTLFIESNCVEIIGNLFKISTTVRVGNKSIAEGMFTYVLTKS